MCVCGDEGDCMICEFVLGFGVVDLIVEVSVLEGFVYDVVEIYLFVDFVVVGFDYEVCIVFCGCIDYVLLDVLFL